MNLTDNLSTFTTFFRIYFCHLLSHKFLNSIKVQIFSNPQKFKIIKRILYQFKYSSGIAICLIPNENSYILFIIK